MSSYSSATDKTVLPGTAELGVARLQWENAKTVKNMAKTTEETASDLFNEACKGRIEAGKARRGALKYAVVGVLKGAAYKAGFTESSGAAELSLASTKWDNARTEVELAKEKEAEGNQLLEDAADHKIDAIGTSAKAIKNTVVGGFKRGCHAFGLC